MSILYALRYFQIVAVVPPLFIGAFVIAVGAAALRLTSDPSAAVEALTPVLILQLFAASSGFRVPARRGHYDLLLTSGVPRWQIAIAHCLASVLPGIGAWLCVGLLEAAASHGTSLRAATLGSVVGFACASFLAWAAAITGARSTAALIWVLVLTIPPIARIVSPVQALGISPQHPALVAAVACVAIGVPTTVACAWIARMSIPLEGSQ